MVLYSANSLDEGAEHERDYIFIHGESSSETDRSADSYPQNTQTKDTKPAYMLHLERELLECKKKQIEMENRTALVEVRLCRALENLSQKMDAVLECQLRPRVQQPWGGFAPAPAFLPAPSTEAPLVEAAQRGDWEALLRALCGADDALPLLRQRSRRGHTPLHAAAAKGHARAARLLLTAGAPVRARARRLRTPLHYAAAGGHAEIVKLLLKSGALVDIKDVDGTTPLALAAKHGHAKVVSLLLRHGASPVTSNNEGSTPIILASSGGHTEAIRLLMESRSKKNYKNNVKSNNDGQDGPQKDNCDDKRKHKSVNIDKKNTGLKEEGTSCKESQTNVLKMEEEKEGQLKEDEKTNTKVKDPNIHVHYTMIEEGPGINAGTKTNEEDDLTSVNGEVNVNKLVDVEATTDDDGQIVLLQASKANQWDVVAFLLDQGLIPKKEGNLEESVLVLAAKSGKSAIVHTLLCAGLSENLQQVEAALNIAKSSDVVWTLIDAVPDVVTSSIGSWALLYASEEGHTEALIALLEAGVAVNAQDQSGISALHAAAWNGHVNCLKELLSHGADPNWKDNNGDTPMHKAVLGDRVWCLGILLEAKASKEAKNKQGQTPIELATSAQARAILEKNSSFPDYFISNSPRINPLLGTFNPSVSNRAAGLTFGNNVSSSNQMFSCTSNNQTTLFGSAAQPANNKTNVVNNSSSALFGARIESKETGGFGLLCSDSKTNPSGGFGLFSASKTDTSGGFTFGYPAQPANCGVSSSATGNSVFETSPFGTVSSSKGVLIGSSTSTSASKSFSFTHSNQTGVVCSTESDNTSKTQTENTENAKLSCSTDEKPLSSILATSGQMIKDDQESGTKQVSPLFSCAVQPKNLFALASHQDTPILSKRTSFF